MITRIFRVVVPGHLHADFEEMFRSVSVPSVKSAKGLVSVAIGRPTRWHPDEYAMVSVWTDEAALVAFAGENWSQAKIPHGMEKFIGECWVHHYENFGSE